MTRSDSCDSPVNRQETDHSDAIAAIITPPGEGGIAAVRIAGPDAAAILSRQFVSHSGDVGLSNPFMMRLGHWCDRGGAVLDEVTAVYMPAGRSYTGLEQVEIFCHGGRQVVRAILESILSSGARAADPGEFTRLAFLNGRIDLTKAEAVAEIIAANTTHSLETSRSHLLGRYAELIEEIRARLVRLLAEIEASIDFAEEDIDPHETAALIPQVSELHEEIDRLGSTYEGGRIIREGFNVVIAGPPNAGKSSLFNLLLEQERALVNPLAGTTRDYLSEWIDLDGFAVNLIDTAGLRLGGDEIEQAGQARARELLEGADLVLWLFDLSEYEAGDVPEAHIKDPSKTPRLLIGNKIDKATRSSVDLPEGGCEAGGVAAHISCLTGQGLPRLKQLLVERISQNLPDLTSGIVVTSARHHQKLTDAMRSLASARDALERSESPEVVAVDVKQAVLSLDEITGRVYTEEVLGEIFASFCIGK